MSGFHNALLYSGLLHICGSDARMAALASRPCHFAQIPAGMRARGAGKAMTAEWISKTVARRKPSCLRKSRIPGSAAA